MHLATATKKAVNIVNLIKVYEHTRCISMRMQRHQVNLCGFTWTYNISHNTLAIHACIHIFNRRNPTRRTKHVFIIYDYPLLFRTTQNIASHSKWRRLRWWRKSCASNRKIRACSLGKYATSCCRSAFVIRIRFRRWARWTGSYATAACGRTTWTTVSCFKSDREASVLEQTII